MTKSVNEILISGAGPSGLSLAIFLHSKGFHPRIIDKKTIISNYSKALAVNPRTLELLEESGVTKRFLSNGRKLTAMNIWRNNKVFFRNDLSLARHKYPFILIQSQRESELILHEEVSKRGIRVEYGTQLVGFTKNNPGFSCEMQTENGDRHHHRSDVLIGADGGHSEIRKQLGINFKPFGYHSTWELYDVELDINIPKDDANLFFFNEGGMIMIRMKGDLWRIAGSMKDLLNYLPKHTRIGQIPWQAKFNVNHIVADSLAQDAAVIIGDAAHIHSPFGGRGMNLGIQDAWTVSQLISENRLNEYTAVRKPYLLKTVQRINTLTRLAAADSGYRLLMKKCAWLGKPVFPFVRPTIRNFVLGLD